MSDSTVNLGESSLRAPVKMEYRLGEQTKQRLKEMGARCVRETLDVEHYYDTDSFQLASTQTWLNQHNGRWRLILAEERQLNHDQSDDNKESEAGQSEEAESHLTYSELNDVKSIMSCLSKCLQLQLNHSQLQNMTMESFLNVAQIRVYDSWTSTGTARYSMPDGLSLLVEKNYRNPTETPAAFLMMDADVLSIGSELEKMERLCKDLGLKPKASEDE